MCEYVGWWSGYLSSSDFNVKFFVFYTNDVEITFVTQASEICSHHLVFSLSILLEGGAHTMCVHIFGMTRDHGVVVMICGFKMIIFFPITII